MTSEDCAVNGHKHDFCLCFVLHKCVLCEVHLHVSGGGHLEMP